MNPSFITEITKARDCPSWYLSHKMDCLTQVINLRALWGMTTEKKDKSYHWEAENRVDNYYGKFIYVATLGFYGKS